MQRSPLKFSSKIEVRQSPIEGFGVFARRAIQAGEVLEESPFVVLPPFILHGKNIWQSLKNTGVLHPREEHLEVLLKNLGFKSAEEYYFKWLPEHQPEGEKIIYTVLPLGFGPIYNSSNSTNNADWKIVGNVFNFFAVKNIKKGEEICTFYGYFLDEKGVKFECDDVYNFGLDYFDGTVAFKSIRFGSMESHMAAKSSPFIAEILKILALTSSPVRINKIDALSADGREEASISIPKEVTLAQLFGKLKECRFSSFPQIRFSFEFRDKGNALTGRQITWQR
jgi:hypothetical protein